MTRILILIAAFILCPGLIDSAYAQSAQQKTQDLIATLGKTKYKKKEKKNFSLEIYFDIKSEAVAKNNVRDYAGFYESSEGDYRLDLNILTSGTIEGSGYDSNFSSSQRQNFTLKNARIEGALLTATKVYTDGRTQAFEAVFNNQTTTKGKNPNEIHSRETKYGLGFIYSPLAPQTDIYSRVFLEFRR